MRVITSAAELRAAARRGEWHGRTAGHCPAYQQANVVILPEAAAAEFAGPMVLTMRPIPTAQVQLVRELLARYPHAHGAPLHVGDPEATGIADVGRPDYGEPVPIDPEEVPVFWGCGVTPQAVALKAHAELMIIHEPAQMFFTDLPREGEIRS
jgi:uncharacterized protein YcsI (UPF0317 family)